MPRTVPEWIGKTDDSAPSDECKMRIIERQNDCCALTGKKFGPGIVAEFDHITPLWLGGANRESNLQAVVGDAHKRKTSAEAKVRAKLKSIKAKHLGIKKPKSSLSHPYLKRRFDGTVVDRRTGEIRR